MKTRELLDDEYAALLVVLGRHLVDRHSRLIEDDHQFLDWLARDLRRRPPDAGDWDTARVRRVRKRVLNRALAERFGVPSGGCRPGTRQTVPARIAEAVDDAAREGCAPLTLLAAAAGDGRELWDEECDQWVELPANMGSGRYVALRVAGDSMTPVLHAGDTILVRLGPDVQRDSIIVARRPESGYVVKRVGRVDPRRLELLSLNPAYEPVLLRRDQYAVLGTVVMRWCSHDAEEIPSIPRA